MIEGLPLWVSIVFFLTCLLSIVLFYYSNNKPIRAFWVIVGWTCLNSYLAYTGFYQDSTSMPPRFLLVLLPSVFFIIYGLLPKSQEWFCRFRSTKLSTFMHTIRIPVEIVLFELYVFNAVPKLMTFEGRNFDIAIGISAVIVGFLYLKGRMNKKSLLIWNVVGLGFVLFIFVNGILSSELPFQQFAFDQPNRAVTYFPFILLPATVVPIVIWTHLSDIIKLSKEIRSTS